jgi:hypothetical protein
VTGGKFGKIRINTVFAWRMDSIRQYPNFFSLVVK